MKKINVLVTALLAVMMILPGMACKKDTDDSDSGGDSFANTEYAGTAKVGNHWYPRPLSIRFDDKRNVSAWSNLVLNKYNRDVAGKVTTVETNASGETVLTVLWDLPGEERFNSPQVYTISADRKTISGGTNPLYVLENLPVAPKNVKNIVGFWSQPSQPDWYPDINAIGFQNGSRAYYTQHGKVLMLTHDPTDTNLLSIAYKQDGTRITFTGVHVTGTADRFYPPYYGVLSADGNTLYADALEYTYARLPNTVQTIEWYGPKGRTPTLIRQ